MNLTPEQADWVRARRAAGDAVIGLVVSADGEPPYDPPLGYRPGDWAEPPADWVALTGACETCGGDHRRGRHLIGTWNIPHWEPCSDCIDGRKRATLTVTCPECHGEGMVAHCGRTDNGSDGPCLLAPHAENSPCYGADDVASDWSPVSWCKCGRCSCGSRQFWTEPTPCPYCHETPHAGTIPFVVATVEVVPVVGDPSHWPEERSVVVLGHKKAMGAGVHSRVWWMTDEGVYRPLLTLDRTPTPGVDFVVLLSDVVDA